MIKGENMSDGWEDINVPRGSYYGWTSNPAGAGKQSITGEVMAFSYDGGTDFNGKDCPELTLILTEPTLSFNKQEQFTKHAVGEVMMVTCGLANLQKAVLAAVLKPGDLTKITLIGFNQVEKGIAKDFGIKVKRGSGRPQSNGQRAAAAAPPPQQDPWGAAPPPQQQYAPPPQQQYAPPPQQQAPPAQQDPWGGAPPPQAPNDDPWGSAPPAGAFAGAGGDEPPF